MENHQLNQKHAKQRLQVVPQSRNGVSTTGFIMGNISSGELPGTELSIEYLYQQHQLDRPELIEELPEDY
jgi:hypothetical protein